jgi:subtilisin
MKRNLKGLLFFIFLIYSQISFAHLKINKVPDSYIIVFNTKLAPEELILGEEDRLKHLEDKISKLKLYHKFDVENRYDAALSGFSALMDARTASLIAGDPLVERVEQDQFAHAYVQTLPLGMDRIDADKSSTHSGNGSGSVSGVDIFIIDTGIQSSHPDLKVVGGANFNNGKSYEDQNGHGTHVAGIVAAKDNSSFVVGGAPGANLYSVRVLNNGGTGKFSQILAGVNWVTNRKLNNPSRPMVANMSLGGYTGLSSYNSLDIGIKNSIAAGVVYTVAAGNESQDASLFSPAHVVEAITVGAYNASNNVWASFSNYGPLVDILAPGVSVLSTFKGSAMATMSGTSMAAPHVAAAAALYLSQNPWSTPDHVRSELLTAAQFPHPGLNPHIESVMPDTIDLSVYMGGF